MVMMFARIRTGHLLAFLWTFLWTLLWFCSGLAWSQPGSLEGRQFVTDPAANKYAVILVGASIDETDAEQFRGWAMDLRNALLQDYGYDAGRVTLLLGDEPRRNIGSDGACNGNNIRELFDNLASRIKTRDQLSIFMLGHGTGSGDNAKFNIVGPDLTGAQFAAQVGKVKTANILVVNTTAASHDFTQPLAGEGRVLLSATRSSAERYTTVFPAFLVEGLKEHTADRDKNRKVSGLEMFTYAKARVTDYYSERNTLASEHPAIDDNGDGVFSVDPEGRGDGRLAEIAYLDVSALANVNLSPRAAELRTNMDSLERDIFLLRANKELMEAREYWNRLEPLLIDLAKATRDFNALQNSN